MIGTLNIIHYRTATFLLLIAYCQAQANISRGAYESGNSSSLSRNGTKNHSGLTVTKEELKFNCKNTLCNVTAVYFIQSQSILTEKLKFIAPLRGSKPLISISGRHIPIDKTEQLILNIQSQEKDHFQYQHRYENRYAFTAKFQSGLNVLKVNYRQPMSMYTASSFGVYPFLSRKYNHYFAYYLYPLKSWQLSPDFQLSIQVSAEMPRHRVKLKCKTLTPAKESCSGSISDKTYCASWIKADSYKAKKRKIYAHYIFNRKFPNSIECHIGRRIKMK